MSSYICICLSQVQYAFSHWLSINQLFTHPCILHPDHIYQDGGLFLRAVSVQSAGEYTCHASNSEGNVTRTTNVKIKGQCLFLQPL